MRLSTLLLVPLLGIQRAIALASRPSTLHFQHRFLPFPHASDAIPAWQPLGSASIDADMSATYLGQYSGDAASSDSKKTDNGKGWYQVGMERDGQWVLASTRAVCPLSLPVFCTVHACLRAVSADALSAFCPHPLDLSSI
jgi:hypothetical protein